MTPTQAGHWLSFFRRRFTLLSDREQLTELWQALVETHAITGFRAHDARLAAAMQSYGIDRLLMFNLADFSSLPITVLDPAAPLLIHDEQCYAGTKVPTHLPSSPPYSLANCFNRMSPPGM